MKFLPGKYTLELFAKTHGLTRESALNKISRMKKEGYARVSGGGRQKRIYDILPVKERTPNGFFEMLNKHSPEKINPGFKHYVFGKKYSAERAIIDGLEMAGGARIRNAMHHLFNHVTDWKWLFDAAKSKNLQKEVRKLYYEAKQKTKVRKIPKRYEK